MGLNFSVSRKEYANNKETFFIYTYRAEKKGYTEAITKAVATHNAKFSGNSVVSALTLSDLSNS